MKIKKEVIELLQEQIQKSFCKLNAYFFSDEHDIKHSGL